eukprot:TRINITY_DN1289_c0_g2_i3.p1 TRINITY_DN1289_c0_g2~~TRINITY_DN1289_c0_g2_i3.p1  ORF type:complete len:101 (-),score=3.05 TRINITY_DN1289_c0_g2_i3:191-493(-)
MRSHSPRVSASSQHNLVQESDGKENSLCLSKTILQQSVIVIYNFTPIVHIPSKAKHRIKKRQIHGGRIPRSCSMNSWIEKEPAASKATEKVDLYSKLKSE